MVEGPSDFYAFSYALKRSKWAGKFIIVPGTGSGTLDTLISLALGRSNKFFILLDDDTSGRKAATRYKAKFFLRDEDVQTLGQIEPKFANCELESLLTSDTLDLVEARYGNRKKSSIAHYLAELAASNDDKALSANSLAGVLSVLDLIGSKLLANS